MITKDSITSTTDNIEHQQDKHNSSIHLIVERYGGQQGAGIISIASLQCWAGNLIVGVLSKSLEKKQHHGTGRLLQYRAHQCCVT